MDHPTIPSHTSHNITVSVFCSHSHRNRNGTLPWLDGKEGCMKKWRVNFNQNRQQQQHPLLYSLFSKSILCVSFLHPFFCTYQPTTHSPLNNTMVWNGFSFNPVCLRRLTDSKSSSTDSDSFRAMPEENENCLDFTARNSHYSGMYDSFLCHKHSITLWIKISPYCWFTALMFSFRVIRGLNKCCLVDKWYDEFDELTENIQIFCCGLLIFSCLDCLNYI